MADDVLAISEELREELRGLKVKTSEPLYSRVEYGATGNAAVTKFFNKSTVDGKTDSNIDLDRELPEGHLMVITEIRVSAMPDATLADIIEFAKDAILKFAPTGDARARRFPLDILGAGGGVASAATTVATLGKAQQNAAFRFSVPEVIRGKTPFVCDIVHPAAITPAAATKFQVSFVGVYAYNAAKAAA